MPLIVFDLDGTLIDSRRDLADSTNEMLEGYGAEPLPAHEVAAMVGEGARVLVERAVRRAGVAAPIDDALARFREAYDRRLVNHTAPYAGVVEAVRRAKARATLAVLTNKPEHPSRRLLDAFALTPHFRRVIGGDSSFPRKPDPSSLRFLMEDAGTPSSETLFVGDSRIDVETARAGGVRMCVALYGFGRERGDLDVGDDDLRVEQPADLTRTLEAWLDEPGAQRSSR